MVPAVHFIRLLRFRFVTTRLVAVAFAWLRLHMRDLDSRLRSPTFTGLPHVPAHTATTAHYTRTPYAGSLPRTHTHATAHYTHARTSLHAVYVTHIFICRLPTPAVLPHLSHCVHRDSTLTRSHRTRAPAPAASHFTDFAPAPHRHLLYYTRFTRLLTFTRFAVYTTVYRIYHLTFGCLRLILRYIPGDGGDDFVVILLILLLYDDVVVILLRYVTIRFQSLHSDTGTFGVLYVVTTYDRCCVVDTFFGDSTDLFPTIQVFPPCCGVLLLLICCC